MSAQTNSSLRKRKVEVPRRTVLALVSMNHKDLSSSYYWLPNLQVWVLKKEVEDSQSLCTTFPENEKKSTPTRKSDGVNNLIGKEDEDIDPEAALNDINCPICLTQPKSEESIALLECLHRFCRICIEKWSRVKRECPLCKCNFSGWMQNIKSDKDFEEFVLPVIPKVVPSLETSSQTLSWPYHARGPWRNYFRSERSRNQRTRIFHSRFFFA